ncbi:hypothetical protein Taro_048276 [Colocasia esculenta]|uniref:Uncharacterized protein n=1 Tax=Colocasia esculenta TaxID=4460 RepID=A0A843X857_COLES|nr:hypothetical protein [Colocasia esculenta]
MVRCVPVLSGVEVDLCSAEAKNDGKCAPSPPVDVHTISAFEGQTVDQDVKCITDCGDVSKLIGKRVLLVHIEMQYVANGILISTEIEKVVMVRKIGSGPSMKLLGLDLMLTNMDYMH